MTSDRSRIEALESSLHTAFIKLFEHEDKLKELPEESKQNAVNTLLLTARLNALHVALSRAMPSLNTAWANETQRAVEDVRRRLGIESSS